MRHDARIEAYAEHWPGESTYEPLQVVLETETGIGGPAPLHLDSLLAAGMVGLALAGARLADGSEPYHLPLPVVCLWRHPLTQLPLWASTDFVPVGLTMADLLTWHRQGIPPGLVSRPGGKLYVPATTKGPERYMQETLQVSSATSWVAQACGNASVIAQLLAALGPHVGKKRGWGFGKVRQWRIEPIPSWSLLDERSCLRRPVPMELIAWRQLPAGAEVPLPVLSGWTPPYYHGVLGTQAPCLPAGMAVLPAIFPAHVAVTLSRSDLV